MIFFHSLKSFIHMGGYAPYVWTAYAIALGVLCYQLIVATLRLTRTKKKLSEHYAD